MSVPTEPRGTLADRVAALPPSDVSRLLAPSGAVLVIAPHPDDETLGCGAAVMAALRAGRRVTVALLTGGGMSHPGSLSHPRRSLIALRRREFAQALARLSEGAGGALVDALVLDLPDGAVPHEPARLEAVADRLAERAIADDVGSLWCTWRGDPHCDHEAAAILGDLVEARLHARSREIVRCEYAVWGRFGERVCPRDVIAVPPGALREAKAHAMAAYASQLTPLIDDDPDGFMMPPALTAHFAAAPEVFVPREGDPS